VTAAAVLLHAVGAIDAAQCYCSLMMMLNVVLFLFSQGYLYSAQCKWRNAFTVSFRVRFRVRVKLGSGFDYFHHCAILHCAEYRKPSQLTAVTFRLFLPHFHRVYVHLLTILVR